MKIAIVTAWNEAMREVAEVTIPNREKYCKAYGLRGTSTASSTNTTPG